MSDSSPDLSPEPLSKGERREAVEWAATERASGVGIYETICDVVDRYEATVAALEAELSRRSSGGETAASQQSNTEQALKVMAAALAGLAAKVDAPVFDPHSVEEAPRRFEAWVMEVLRRVNARLSASSTSTPE